MLSGCHRAYMAPLPCTISGNMTLKVCVSLIPWSRTSKGAEAIVGVGVIILDLSFWYSCKLPYIGTPLISQLRIAFLRSMQRKLVFGCSRFLGSDDDHVLDPFRGNIQLPWSERNRPSPELKITEVFREPGRWRRKKTSVKMVLLRG